LFSARYQIYAKAGIWKDYQHQFYTRITQDMSDKFITKYKKEQQDIVSKMEIHRKADESYYFAATKLLELSQPAW